MFKKLNLFSKTEMKLLSFISTKDGEMYEKEIAEQSGISTGSVNSMLKRFSKMGLVQNYRRGRMLFYRRNDDNPLMRQFKVFVTINNLMPLIGKIAPLSRRIILFGSCAEGRDGETSDIDIFILSREKEKIRRILDSHSKIQAIILDSVEYTKLSEKDKPLFERINKGIEIKSDEDG